MLIQGGIYSLAERGFHLPAIEIWDIIRTLYDPLAGA